MDSETVVIFYQIEGRATHRIKIQEGQDLTDLRANIVKESKLTYAADMLLLSATNASGEIPINECYFQDQSENSFKRLISLINVGPKSPLLVAIGTYRYLVLHVYFRSRYSQVPVPRSTTGESARWSWSPQ